MRSLNYSRSSLEHKFARSHSYDKYCLLVFILLAYTYQIETCLVSDSPQCRWDLRSSAVLRNEEWKLSTVVSRQPIGPWIKKSKTSWPSVRMEQLGSHWSDFHEIWYFSIFWKSVGKNSSFINPLNAELNPICHLLALLRPHHILHTSRIRVKVLQ
jgi:hypothetical protein